MKRDWKAWFKWAGIRALKTVAQTAIATIGTTALLTSIAGIPEEQIEDNWEDLP